MTGPRRRYGPDIGEPPPVFDPRRGGSLVGIAGGLVFVFSYSPALGSAAMTTAVVAAVALALTALFLHYVRPVALGVLLQPSRRALATYGLCVVAELALIGVGTRALAGAGHADLRPALIAAVVGLHFIPFAWAFTERMFFWLGGGSAGLGVIGLVGGAAGLSSAAELSAVATGLLMLGLITGYAGGKFVPTPHRTAGGDGADQHAAGAGSA